METKQQDQSKKHELQKMPTNSKELWAVTSKMEISVKNSSVQSIREIQTPALSSMIKKDGESIDKSECHMYIQLMIVFLNEFFGVTWSDFQVKETSMEFYSNFYYWKLADIKLFCSRCKSLYYGKAYGYTPAVFMEWAVEYDKEWSVVSIDSAIHTHEVLKKVDERATDKVIRVRREKEEEFHRVHAEWVRNRIIKDDATDK